MMLLLKLLNCRETQLYDLLFFLDYARMKPRSSSTSVASSGNSRQCSNDKLLKCHAPGCRQTFSYRMERSRHMKKHHSNIIKKKLPFIVTQDEQYSCVQCSALFKHRPSIYKHLKICGKLKEKETICSVCNKSFDYPSRLTTHMTTHEKEIRSCNKCGKIYKREDHLQKHQEACSTTRTINFSHDPCLMEIQSQTTAASAQLSDNTSVSPVDYDAEMESLY